MRKFSAVFAALVVQQKTELNRNGAWVPIATTAAQRKWRQIRISAAQRKRRQIRICAVFCCLSAGISHGDVRFVVVPDSVCVGVPVERGFPNHGRLRIRGTVLSLAWISVALQFVPRLLVSNQEPGDELENGWNSRYSHCTALPYADWKKSPPYPPHPDTRDLLENDLCNSK